jgi:hypothetical protein
MNVESNYENNISSFIENEKNEDIRKQLDD